MSTFVELSYADAFCEGKEDALYRGPEFWFKRLEWPARKNRAYIRLYMSPYATAALCGSQFRIHVFSVSICGCRARLIRWDRSRAELHQQGYDNVCSEELERAGFFRDRLEGANIPHRGFRKIMVPSRDDHFQQKPFLVSYPLPRDPPHSPFWRSIGF